MRKLLRRLSPQSCTGCHERVSAFAVACADCGANLRSERPARVIRQENALVWLLGGAVLGCVAMLALGPLVQS